jgi:hypothetical protein
VLGQESGPIGQRPNIVQLMTALVPFEQFRRTGGLFVLESVLAGNEPVIKSELEKEGRGRSTADQPKGLFYFVFQRKSSNPIFPKFPIKLCLRWAETISRKAFPGSRMLLHTAKKQQAIKEVITCCFLEAANFMTRYCPEAKAFHTRKCLKENYTLATKALACKIA